MSSVDFRQLRFGPLSPHMVSILIYSLCQAAATWSPYSLLSLLVLSWSTRPALVIAQEFTQGFALRCFKQ